jgi:hypothetical protein
MHGGFVWVANTARIVLKRHPLDVPDVQSHAAEHRLLSARNAQGSSTVETYSGVQQLQQPSERYDIQKVASEDAEVKQATMRYSMQLAQKLRSASGQHHTIIAQVTAGLIMLTYLEDLGCGWFLCSASCHACTPRQLQAGFADMFSRLLGTVQRLVMLCLVYGTVHSSTGCMYLSCRHLSCRHLLGRTARRILVSKTFQECMARPQLGTCVVHGAPNATITGE